MNAKEFEEHKKNCKMCNRKGLPILLTRYAIAQKRSGAPSVSGNFRPSLDATGKPAPALDADSLYTQRMLRAGYLYIHDEENINEVGRKAPWKGYVVNREGYLTPFPVPVPPPPYVLPSPTAADKPCDPWANEALARCITILNPEKPRTIWIGFSDTRWTDAVLKAHEDPEYRNRHMRRFDVGQWWNAVTHSHACGLDQCTTNIAEFQKSISVKDFAFSPAEFIVPRHARDTETLEKLAGEKARSYPVSKEEEDRLASKIAVKVNGLKGEEQKELIAAWANCTNSTPQLLARAAERLLGAENKHKAAIVALDDPAGLLMDLSVYMDYALKQYTDEVIPVKFNREITISSIISVLKKGVIEAEKNKIIKESKRKPIEMHSGNSYDAGPGLAKMQVENPNFEKICSQAWDKYAEKIDEEKVKAWPKKVQESIKSFDQDYIVPLANAYVAWFDSPVFVGNMECNHDPAHLESGLAYTELASLCLGGVQDKAPILDYLIQKLTADRFDRVNVPMRAFVFNQDQYVKIIEDAVKSLTGASVDVLKVWADVVDKMAAAIGATSETNQKGMNNALSGLTLKVGAVLIRVMQNFADTGDVSTLLMTLGATGGTSFHRIPVRGTEAKALNLLLKKIEKITGVPKDNGKAVIAAQAKLREIKAAQQGDTVEFNTVVAIRLHQLETDLSAATNLQGQDAQTGAKIKAFLDSVSVSPDDLLIAEQEFNEAVRQSAQRNLPFVASMLGGIVQMFSLFSANQAVEKARRTKINVQGEEFKYYGAISGMLAAATGIAEQLGGRSETILHLAPALFDKERVFIKYGGKLFGFVGGAISLYWNAEGTGKAWQNKQYGIAILYGIATVADAVGLGLILCATFFKTFSAAYAVLLTGIGLAVFVVGLLVMFGLMLFADDPLQEWLGKCVFGKDVAGRYQNVDDELRGLGAISA